jgi:hypothetical protein
MMLPKRERCSLVVHQRSSGGYAPRTFGVLAENAEALGWFMRLQTQWRVGHEWMRMGWIMGCS